MSCRIKKGEREREGHASGLVRKALKTQSILCNTSKWIFNLNIWATFKCRAAAPNSCERPPWVKLDIRPKNSQQTSMESLTPNAELTWFVILFRAATNYYFHHQLICKLYVEVCKMSVSRERCPMWHRHHCIFTNLIQAIVKNLNIISLSHNLCLKNDSNY